MKNLITARKTNKFTQADTAKILNISLRQYQYYEKGESDFPVSKLIILANYFNVSIDYLVGLDDVPNRKNNQ
ncbi:Helix-turn-helix domain-containing protein [Pilibacter termitis]|uniref:Helix-turn-helix domain-containing protein n=1 Tax=Pilibacter termitis TaxID=263852 RepID=A0A1T4QZU7_9ENTE|nr:helix-turn-helix transcriptional regulator [Pilibacter termitis]SKA08868.1 Helix-turn-helix domain-containing protein [Pilibacter termitis]